jgi:hypothetical protein
MSTSTATKLVDLHILNLRQTVGSLEFATLSPKKHVEMGDVRVFMKDVGYSRSNLSIFNQKYCLELEFLPQADESSRDFVRLLPRIPVPQHHTSRQVA